MQQNIVLPNKIHEKIENHHVSKEHYSYIWVLFQQDILLIGVKLMILIEGQMVLGNVQTKILTKKRDTLLQNVCFAGKYIIERGLFMNGIISKIYRVIHQSDNLMDMGRNI